jgi:methionine-S-sulfoxide reductase
VIFWLVAALAFGEAMPGKLEKATFAAGCFWGVEKVFGALPGVVSTRVGYTGGTVKNPSYEQVCTGGTGHAEAIEITYDPSKISYAELLEVFFRHHDPTTKDRQGNDVGSQYRSAIFAHSPAQKKDAEAAVRALEAARVFKSPVVTEIAPASEFYAAEDYHQKYLKKNPFGYCHIQLQSAKIGEVLKNARAD